MKVIREGGRPGVDGDVEMRGWLWVMRGEEGCGEMLRVVMYLGQF